MSEGGGGVGGKLLGGLGFIVVLVVFNVLSYVFNWGWILY